MTRFVLPLWVYLGFALLVFGVAMPGSATAHGRDGASTASARASSTEPVTAAIAAPTPLRERAAAPSGLGRDDRDPNLAIATAAELESEDEDASETFVPASHRARARSGVIDPCRSSAVGTRRRSVSTGLGRGPPHR